MHKCAISILHAARIKMPRGVMSAARQVQLMRSARDFLIIPKLDWKGRL